MKLKIVIIGILIIALSAFAYREIDKRSVSETLPILSIYPDTIYPGDPIFVTINASSTVDKIQYDKKDLNKIRFGKQVISIIPTDFYEKANDHFVEVSLSNGMKFKNVVSLIPRERIERPLGIPEKLGGNTKEAGKKLVNNLEIENKEINNIKSDNRQYWSETFGKPLDNIFVTDTFGYDRNTVGYTILHKGTDFRAATGTPVYAMNDGVVRISKTFTVYGNVVAIDHGYGLITMYMHLSKLLVNEGDVVKKGDKIGESGQTGYVSAPHLHISIKINGISVDPFVFMNYFKIK